MPTLAPTLALTETTLTPMPPLVPPNASPDTPLTAMPTLAPALALNDTTLTPTSGGGEAGPVDAEGAGRGDGPPQQGRPVRPQLPGTR